MTRNDMQKFIAHSDGHFYASATVEQEALLMQRNHSSTLSVEIVYNAAQMFDGLHVKTSATGE